MHTTQPPAATPQQALDRATEALDTMLTTHPDAQRKAGYRATRKMLGAAHNSYGHTIADNSPERDRGARAEAETLTRTAMHLLQDAEDLTLPDPDDPNEDDRPPHPAAAHIEQALDHLAVALHHYRSDRAAAR